jgi:alpha-L-fucosidase 2
MKKILFAMLSTLIAITAVFSQEDISKYNVRWEGQSENSWGSMPIGNGDIGSNAWVDKKGNLTLIISKTDSHSEIGRLLKIGKINISFTPNLLSESDFFQELDLKTGMIKITSKKNNQVFELNCWVDANNPAIHIEGKSNLPFEARVTNQVWRKEAKPLIGNERHSGYGVAFREEPFTKEVDTIMKNKNSLIWCHENKTSIWQMTLDNQNISDFNKEGKDPLINQHFGALVKGKNLVNINDTTLKTAASTKNFSLTVVVKKMQTKDIKTWEADIVRTYNVISQQNHQAQINAHKTWWKNFWDTHYIIVDSKNEAEKTFKITQGYMLQRYTTACSGRGSLPIKFNGSIFTVDVNENLASGLKGYDADYREWGGNYWFQNTRLIYWSMFYAGDLAFIKPFFNLYKNALPLAMYRTKKYFNHEGAYFPETLTPWGSYLIDNYGWDRKGKQDGVSDNLYIRYYWQGSLELCTMLIDYVDYTNDTTFFQQEALPFINEIIKFYDTHYQRDEKGKLFISPAQSLETYQKGVTNPLPEIAGLHWVLNKIKEHASLVKDQTIITRINRFQAELPEIPMGMLNGKKVLLAGSNLGERVNIENPELYAIFPYRFFSKGKPNEEIGLETFENRQYKKFVGWHQDGIQAALLGLTQTAKQAVTENFSMKHKGSRFPSFWGPNYDWLPDQDHGSVSMLTLQHMLIQTERDEVMLFPAWPENWEVKFKLHIPNNKIIQGSYKQVEGVKLNAKPTGVNLKIALN